MSGHAYDAVPGGTVTSGLPPRPSGSRRAVLLSSVAGCAVALTAAAAVSWWWLGALGGGGGTSGGGGSHVGHDRSAAWCAKDRPAFDDAVASGGFKPPERRYGVLPQCEVWHGLGMTDIVWTGELEASERRGVYVSSPSVLRLGGSVALASHDFHGHGTAGWPPFAVVYRSDDGGVTWPANASSVAADVYWASLFEDGGAAHLIGVSRPGFHCPNGVAVLRSPDGGRSWPAAGRGVVLRSGRDGPFTTGAVPVLRSGGRLWRAFERGRVWARGTVVVLSAATGSDLTSAASWRVESEAPFSAAAAVEPRWPSLGAKQSRGWLEGNAVELPGGGVGVLVRANTSPSANMAILVPGGGGRKAEYVRFPGGQTKFSVRRHEASGTYVTLVNYVTDERVSVPPACAADDFATAARVHASTAPGARHLPCCSPGSLQKCGGKCAWCRSLSRHELWLATSDDLRNWCLSPRPVLSDDSGDSPWLAQLVTGFQYADFAFDGDDHVLAVVRVAYRGAVALHNANRVSVKRIKWRGATKCGE